MIPVLFEESKYCCGCSACFAVCPKNAIYMKYDKKGFLYPRIDASKCIGCRKCISVCAFKLDQKQKGLD